MFVSKKNNPSDTPSLRELYNSACKKRQIEDNEFQREIISKLEQVSHAFFQRDRFSFFSTLHRMFCLGAQRRIIKSPQGLYIWGSVGVGKTFMMDLFYDSLTTKNKKRYHFHEFMEMIHRSLKKTNEQNPLRWIAKTLLNNSKILFLDEFHVNDITDAMLLGKLLEYLFNDEIFLITTSNAHPEELYKNGLQRERFLSAITTLKNHLIVARLSGAKDYRLEAFNQEGVTEKELLSGESLRKLFNRLTAADSEPSREINLYDREIKLQASSQGVAWFTFKQLCEDNRSTSEYIELAIRFHTVLIEDIPSLNDDGNDATRRFINLVDELYEKNVNVIISSQFTVNQYYTGRKLAELFKRTESRLLEMSTTNYISKPHLGAERD